MTPMTPERLDADPEDIDDEEDLHEQLVGEASAEWGRLNARTIGTLAIVLGSLVIVVLFGGGGRSFRIDATGDPDLTFDWSFFWALVPSFLEALWVTAQATIAGFLVAVVVGLALALGRRSTRRWISWPTASAIEFVRSTPLLVQLYFIYFALPELGIVLGSMTALILGLGVHYGTYCSEAYRAGIDSVPKGQWEAATAMNLGPATTWGRVILPQAIPNVLPALGNFFVAAFKDAPLGSAIQVTGVLFWARTVSGRTFRYVETYTLVGIGFLLVSISAAWLIRRMERRIGYDRLD
ncbi:MAG: ectoine/hydroxyectoine ABC transporter permease subunit EhuD [Actinomycetota bacterium]|nr:ectoine/hydroxyectoine ABC transporter permease subunit EhuD [Actinomycetota bacterium]